MKYSDLLCQFLKNAGYTHCFTLQGGGIMHLINSANKYFILVPVVHEVAAVIGAEYFNATEQEGKKAFALVTTGPGFTNTITAVAGAFLESREVLIIGGQVKTADQTLGGIRQCGIQEVDGVSIAKPITKQAIRLEKPYKASEIYNIIKKSAEPRKGPVFIEVPLDVQGANLEEKDFDDTNIMDIVLPIKAEQHKIMQIAQMFKNSQRPAIILGGGISKALRFDIEKLLEKHNFAVFTTWNGADLLSSDHKLYFGRPNTWGMRYSNILQQQCDFLVAIGTRMGMQQTGFNYQEFLPNGKLVHVECDESELNKKNPGVDYAIHADANSFVLDFLAQDLGNHQSWTKFCEMVKNKLPLNEYYNNQTHSDYLSPYEFYEKIVNFTKEGDNIIPCSSGGAFTAFQQGMLLKKDQVTISNKGLASMGYGLAGAIGAAIARPNARTLHFEGDGGFAQNMQELGTVKANNLNIKMFIFNDGGYASIRMTQRNYFNGKYVGCDKQTGLGLPNWHKLFDSFDMPSLVVNKGFENDPKFLKLFSDANPVAFIVSIDPEQTYLPKITSKILDNGSMASNPIHKMTPDLSEETKKLVFKYINIT